jgi:hypothetical protein
MCIRWDLNDNLGFEHEQGLPARTSAGGPRPATPDRVAGDRDGQRRFRSAGVRAATVFPGRNLTMPTSTVTRTPTQAQTKPQPSEDEREQARRALQTSMDTRQ